MLINVWEQANGCRDGDISGRQEADFFFVRSSSNLENIYGIGCGLGTGILEKPFKWFPYLHPW